MIIRPHSTLTLAVPVDEDLRFPAQAINPAGSLAPPTVNTTNGLLEFVGNADNIIAGVAQLPHSWFAGSAVTPHIHLRFPTAEAAVNTRWKFEYSLGNISGNFSQAYTAYAALTVITVANPNNALAHVIADFEDLTMTGYTESCAILWRLSRLASSDGADTDTNSCALIEFDIHYLAEKFGKNV